MQTETQVATKQPTAMVTNAMAAAMKDAGISASDLVIPKLLLMQNTSEYVGDGKAELGDIMNSQTMEVIGGVDKPVVIVPLSSYKTWRVYDVSSQPPTFVRQDPVNSQNEHREWEGVENGVPMRYDLCFNFFVLLKTDLDINEAFPCVISFKRTSMNAGKTLATHMFKQSAIGQAMHSKTVLLNVSKEKKEKNTYAIYSIGKGETLSPEHKAIAAQWVETMKTVRYTVDESTEETPVTAGKTETVAPTVAPQQHGEEKF